MEDIRVGIDIKGKMALERLMLFKPGQSKKEVVSNLILAEVAKFKGKKPPKGKK